VPIDDLVAHLEREAEAEVGRLLAAARLEAAAIEDRAAAEAARRRATETERLEREGATAIRDAMVTMRRDERRRHLVARAAVLDRAFELADGMLRGLTVGRYRHRLEPMAAEALPYVEGRAASLACPPGAAPAVAAFLTGHPNVRVTTAEDATPGILVQADDGSVVVDNTLPAQLARRRSELAIRLAVRLGGPLDAVG
jgi:vacuolar-type H+-ATPase subunit E/Vma4